MALFVDFFTSRAKPGWMFRTLGRKFTEVCLLSFDMIAEGMYQGRLAFLGSDPPDDACFYAQKDRGITKGSFEANRNFALRLRRWQWSHRAKGLAGVPDIIVHGESVTGWIPTSFSGRPTRAGVMVRCVNDGVVGTPGIQYSISEDGGATFGPVTDLGTDTTITVGEFSMTWVGGRQWGLGEELIIEHGGRGLIMNDLGAPVRKTPAGSPAGGEGFIHELRNVLSPYTPRIRLASANGDWYTLEPDGYLWRLVNGPWAWETAKDATHTQDWRGVIIVDASALPYEPWLPVGSELYEIGVPLEVFGSTTQVYFWNRWITVVQRFKAAQMLALSTILSWNPNLFDPSIPSTCMHGDWYVSHGYDSNGDMYVTRPIEDAWFSALE